METSSSSPKSSATPVAVHSTESSLYHFSLDFMFYSLSLIVPVGLVCNSVSVAVFATRQMRRRASSWYLAALAVSDNLSLVAITFDYWLKNQKVGLQVMRTSGAVCTGITHLSYFSRLLSAWLVTTFTVERFVAVVYPLRRPSVGSTAHARNVIAVEGVASAVLSSFTLFTIGIVRDDKDGGGGGGGGAATTDCDVLPQMATAYVTFNVIFLIFGSIVVPVLTIVILNFVILRKISGRSETFVPSVLWPSSAASAPARHHDYHPQPQPQPHPHSHHHRHRHYRRQGSCSQPEDSCFNSGADRWTPGNGPSPPSSGARPLRYRPPLRDYNVTTVLLAVSTTFVVLNVPYCVSWFVAFFRHYFGGDGAGAGGAGAGGGSREVSWKLIAAKYITSVPYFLNYGLNFVLYSLCARTFRAQLRRTARRISCCCYCCCCGRGRKNLGLRGRGGDGGGGGGGGGNDANFYHTDDVMNVVTLFRNRRRRQTRGGGGGGGRRRKNDNDDCRKTVSAPLPRTPLWSSDLRFSGQRTSEELANTE